MARKARQTRGKLGSRKARAVRKTRSSGDTANLKRELANALSQQSATADILRIISRSTADAQPVFDAITRAATRLVGGRAAGVFRYIDGLIDFMSTDGSAADAAALRRVYPVPADE